MKPAPICLVGFRYDAASSFERGAADGPPALREALWSPASNSWSESGVDIAAPGFLTDAGDVAFDTPEAADAGIAKRIEELLGDGFRPLSLGGDHSITYPIVRAVSAELSALTILHFDAHPDLYDEFDGSRLSHACPFARIMEDGLAGRLVQVGLRAVTSHQRDQARRFGVEQIEIRETYERLRSDRGLPGLNGPVYVSIDLDVLDPAHAPGVAHIEPGGLTTRELLSMIHALPGTVIGADVVELNPRRDVRGLAAAAGAKIVKELVATMMRGQST